MSVIVKGMGMPKNCWNCEFCRTTVDKVDFCILNRKQYNFGLEERPSDCPLADVREDMDMVDLACWYDENILYPKRIEGKT